MFLPLLIVGMFLTLEELMCKRIVYRKKLLVQQVSAGTLEIALLNYNDLSYKARLVLKDKWFQNRSWLYATD